ncbi:hypothetical protein L7F22_002611 [Adiantum nelumboides]|nr:hypothetical protein [Adiantum nelumboides]
MAMEVKVKVPPTAVYTTVQEKKLLLKLAQHPNFMGEGVNVERDAEVCLEAMDEYFEAAETHPQNQTMLAVFRLTGDAKIWWKTHCRDSDIIGASQTWEQIKDAVTARYLPPAHKATKINEFFSLRQMSSTLEEYYFKFVTLRRYAPKMTLEHQVSNNAIDQAHFDVYMQGALDDDMAKNEEARDLEDRDEGDDEGEEDEDKEGQEQPSGHSGPDDNDDDDQDQLGAGPSSGGAAIEPPPPPAFHSGSPPAPKENEPEHRGATRTTGRNHLQLSKNVIIPTEGSIGVLTYKKRKIILFDFVKDKEMATSSIDGSLIELDPWLNKEFKLAKEIQLKEFLRVDDMYSNMERICMLYASDKQMVQKWKMV